MDWQVEFEAELRRGTLARARGNEGRARVCARRAAGIVAREYLAPKGVSRPNAGALDVLKTLRLDPALPPDAVPLIDHLTQRVDEAFLLPAGVDLIADARQLLSLLDGD
jgi:hypothetical protein